MKPNKKIRKESNSGLQNYARYSGLAFQMIIIILVFVWAGKKLDHKYSNDGLVFTIIFSLIGVFIALYVALKDFIHIKKNK